MSEAFSNRLMHVLVGVPVGVVWELEGAEEEETEDGRGTRVRGLEGVALAIPLALPLASPPPVRGAEAMPDE